MASSPSPNRSQPKEKIYDGDGVLINWQMADTMSANNMNELIDRGAWLYGEFPGTSLLLSPSN